MVVIAYLPGMDSLLASGGKFGIAEIPIKYGSNGEIKRYNVILSKNIAQKLMNLGTNGKARFGEIVYKKLIGGKISTDPIIEITLNYDRASLERVLGVKNYGVSPIMVYFGNKAYILYLDERGKEELIKEIIGILDSKEDLYFIRREVYIFESLLQASRIPGNSIKIYRKRGEPLNKVFQELDGVLQKYLRIYGGLKFDTKGNNLFGILKYNGRKVVVEIPLDKVKETFSIVRRLMRSGKNSFISVAANRVGMSIVVRYNNA